MSKGLPFTGLSQYLAVSYSSAHCSFVNFVGYLGGNMYTLFILGPIIVGLRGDPSVCVLVAGRGI